MTRSRRRLKLRPLIIILIISGLIATVSYGYFVAPNQVSFNKIQYRSASISTTFNDFQITLISDLNLTDSDDVDGLNELISDINSQGSNMVLFAGDLFESAVFDETNVISILSSIKTSSGKFAVLGDKDIPNKANIIAILNKAGFEVLQNEKRLIYFKDDYFTLYGIDPSSNLESLTSEKSDFSITLAHEPDSFQTNRDLTSLQLSGHTNGGYIYLPLIGGLIKKTNGAIYTHGRYDQNQSTLFVSNGYDEESNLKFKFLCNNHIDILKLKHKESATTSQEDSQSQGTDSTEQ